jgi:hypothetical protein
MSRETVSLLLGRMASKESHIVASICSLYGVGFCGTKGFVMRGGTGERNVVEQMQHPPMTYGIE